jgi:hypothetical protein
MISAADRLRPIQPVKETSTRNLPGGKARRRRVRLAISSPTENGLSSKCGILDVTFLWTSMVTRISLLFFYHMKVKEMSVGEITF